jgi:hypothetical protein
MFSNSRFLGSSSLLRRQSRAVLPLLTRGSPQGSAWRRLPFANTQRINSSSSVAAAEKSYDEVANRGETDLVSFPAVGASKSKPVLLNSKEHVVGYLSKILNARVYDAAIETELQHAKNLSTVRII